MRYRGEAWPSVTSGTEDRDRNVQLCWPPDYLGPLPSFLGSKHVRSTEEAAGYQRTLGEDEEEHGADN